MPRKARTRRPKFKTALQLEGLPTLQALIDHLALTATDAWDAIIVGDGSGQGWKMGGGWGAVLIDRYSGAREFAAGAMLPCTVALAELFPYIQLMAWYADGVGRRRQREAAAAGRNLTIHIVTDSQFVATCGMRPQSRQSHRAIWATIDAYREDGFNLVFHFVRRSVVDLNILVDEVARQARLSLDDVYSRAIKVLQREYPGIPDDATVYDFSPNQPTTTKPQGVQHEHTT